jgi:conjugal transfer pilus assembly protein TraA
MQHRMLNNGAVIALAILVTFAATDAMAGTGGAAFEQVWMDLTDWTTGTLGRVISGAFILVGTIMGIARQSVTNFAVGVGAGVGLNNAPKIIESVVTATLPVMADASSAIHGAGGGLL